MNNRNLFRNVTIGSVAIWLIAFVFTPFLLVVIASFMVPTKLGSAVFSFQNYYRAIDPLYFTVFWRSFIIANLVTVICLFVGYPFAIFLTQLHKKTKQFFLILMIIPFWTSTLIRSYAIMALIKTKGLLNSFLLGMGVIHQPLQLLFTNTAVIIGLVYNLLPFMILPIYSNADRLDFKQIEAAIDLGASNARIFFQIILPQTLSGIFSGIILVLLPAMTLFYIPNLLGGAKSLMLGNLIENQFLTVGNWPIGAALSVLLTLFLLMLLMIQQLLIPQKKRALL